MFCCGGNKMMVTEWLGRRIVGMSRPLEQVRSAIITHHYSRSTERAYRGWIVQYVTLLMGSLVLGITALRRRTQARWTTGLFVALVPPAVMASVVVLPTTPSGALWLFSLSSDRVGISSLEVASRRSVPPDNPWIRRTTACAMISA